MAALYSVTERTSLQAVFMDLVDLTFRAAGAFYLFAGHIAARGMLMEAVTDRMIATLVEEEDMPSSGKHSLLGAGVVLTGTSGVALMLMSFWALPLFLANVGVQFGWIGLALWKHPPRDAEAVRGRRRTINAAVLYALVALGVLWAWEEGRLGDYDDALAAGIVTGAAVYFAGWLVRDLRWRPGRGRRFDDPALLPHKALPPRRVRLDPQFGAWPLVDLDRGCRVNHLTWLPEALAFRIEDWDDTFQLAFDGDEPSRLPDFGSADRAAAYVEEGRAIALALRDHFGAGRVDVAAMLEPPR